jgi:hypothetical protein
MKTIAQLLEALRAGGLALDAASGRAPSVDELMRLALEPKTIELRDAAGEAVTKSRRRELLRELNQGEPIELRLSAIVFRQSTTARPLPLAKRSEANANYTVIEPERLEQFAASFKRRPFLRDHNSYQLEAVGGIIESCVAEASDGWVEFRQELHLQAEWAVRAALNGTLRTFSIGAGLRRGAKLRESLQCSVCDRPWLGEGACSHWPGDEVQLDGGQGRVIVELIWRNVQARETSGVSFPAVQGTKIDDVTKLTEDHQGTLMRETLIKLLKLAADATDADIAAAVERLDTGSAAAESARAELGQQVTLLAAREEELTATRAELATARTELATQAETTRQAGEDGLVTRALSEGRLRPGQAAIETHIRSLAKVDLAAATEFVDGLLKLDPIGGPPQTPPPAPKHTAENKFGLTEQQLDICAQMGVEPEKYRELLDAEQQQGA